MIEVHGVEKAKYHSKLQFLAVEYIDSVDEFCGKYPQYSSFVDRPNVHRLLELVMHTIPLFSNAQLISEMLFESSHQPLKFALSRNTSPRAHIYAVNLVLAKDWFTRISSVWTDYLKATSKTEKERSEYSVLNLFTGSIANNIDWRSESMNELRIDMMNLISNSMSGCVSKQLVSWYGSNIVDHDGTSSWHPIRLTKTESINHNHRHMFFFREMMSRTARKDTFCTLSSARALAKFS